MTTQQFDEEQCAIFTMADAIIVNKSGTTTNHCGRMRKKQNHVHVQTVATDESAVSVIVRQTWEIGSWAKYFVYCVPVWLQLFEVVRLALLHQDTSVDAPPEVQDLPLELSLTWVGFPSQPSIVVNHASVQHCRFVVVAWCKPVFLNEFELLAQLLCDPIEVLLRPSNIAVVANMDDHVQGWVLCVQMHMDKCLR